MAFTPFPTSTPSSLEAMLASMQGGSADTMPMPVSDPGVAPLPGPSPMPGGAKPGPDFGGIAQKALPMILAFLANKKGGPLAGAGLLDGLTQGLARKRKAEQDAHELELQTINDETVRNERVAERQRTQQVQRANWLTNLQTQLAQIDDPVAFASTLDLADKVGASAFGFQPGELKSTFRFPKERETAAAASDANALLKKLKETHGDNLPALMQSNALVTFRGKQTPLRDVMAAAGVLASDDKGAPLLPASKEEADQGGSDFARYLRDVFAEATEKKGAPLTAAERRKISLDARKEFNQIDDPARRGPDPTTAAINALRLEQMQRGQGAMTPAQNALASRLSNDYEQASKDYLVRLSASQTVETAAKDPSAAGDLALIFAFMKMLDPGSTVREGEFANAQNAAGVGDQIRNAYNRAMNGQRLNPTQRADFVRQSKAQFEQARNRQRGLIQAYAARARRGGLNPDDVVIDYDSVFGVNAAQSQAEDTSVPKEGDEREIPGAPGSLARFQGGKWVRIK